MQAPTAPGRDWPSWGTTDDNGNFLTLREQAAQRKEQAMEMVATQLGETGTRMRGLIKEIVRVIGTTTTLAVYEETLAIEQNGGMMLPDGSRRRTPGGVFFKLVKTNYPETRGIFHQYDNRPKKKKGPAQTPKKERPVQKHTGEQKQEKETTVKIQIFGRPSSRVVDQGTYVVMIFQTNKPPAALPKGLPAPTDTKTNYVVSVSAKQWKMVADALDDPEDQFIIEGFPQPDKNGSIAVFTQSITTRKQQKAKYAKPAEPL